MVDPAVTKWVIARKETIKELRQLGENMNEHARNATIASSVGGGTSVLAGVGAAACYYFAPLTLGASLVPAGVLTGLAVAGGVTSIGATITNYFIEQGYIGSVQKALDKDKKSFEELEKAIEKAKKESEVVEIIEGVVNIVKIIPDGVKLGTSAARRLVVSGKAASNLLKLGRTARVAGHALAAVAVPLDILFFVKDVIDLSNGNVSEAAKKVWELADKLEKELKGIIADACVDYLVLKKT